MMFDELWALDPAVAVVVFKDQEDGLTRALASQMSFDDLMSVARIAMNGNLRNKAFGLAVEEASTFNEHRQVFEHSVEQRSPHIDSRWLRNQTLARMTKTAETLTDWCHVYHAATAPEWQDGVLNTAAAKVKELAKTPDDLCLLLRLQGSLSSLGSLAREQLKDVAC